MSLVPDERQAHSQIPAEARVKTAPEVIGRLVGGIDEIVRPTLSDGWQTTVTGESETQKVLRRTLLMYTLHTETGLVRPGERVRLPALLNCLLVGQAVG